MVSSMADQQQTVLVDGKLLSGDAMREYAKLKGLCPICVQTVTQKRVRKKFGRLRAGLEWEPLTQTDDVAGNFTVYKGYCLQPTCWTLEEVQVKLGEKNPAKQKKSKRRKSPSARNRRPSSRHSLSAQSHTHAATDGNRSKFESQSFMEKKQLKLIDETALIEETARSLSARSAEGSDFSTRSGRQSLYASPAKQSRVPASRRPTFAAISTSLTPSDFASESTDFSEDLELEKKAGLFQAPLGSDFGHPSSPPGIIEPRGRSRRASRRHTEFSKQQYSVSDQQPLTLASLCAVAECSDQLRRPSVASVVDEDCKSCATDYGRRPSLQERRRSSGVSSFGPAREDSATMSSMLGSVSDHQRSSFMTSATIDSPEGPRSQDRLQALTALLSYYMYEDEDGTSDGDVPLWSDLKTICNSRIELSLDKENSNRHFQFLLLVITQSKTSETREKAWQLLAVVVEKKKLHMDSNHHLTMNFFQAITSVLDSGDADESGTLVKEQATKVLFSLIRLEALSASSIFTNMIAMLERGRRLEWVATLLDRLMFSESECDNTAESLFVVWKLLQLQSNQARDTGSVDCQDEMLMMTMIVGLVDSMLSGYVSGEIPLDDREAALKAEASLGLLAFVASHAGATALADRQQECILATCSTVIRYQFDSVVLEGSKALCAILPFFRVEDETSNPLGEDSGVVPQVVKVVDLLFKSQEKIGNQSDKDGNTNLMACRLLGLILGRTGTSTLSSLSECKDIMFSLVELLSKTSDGELVNRSSECLILLMSQDAITRELLRSYPDAEFVLVGFLSKHSGSTFAQEKICTVLQHLGCMEGTNVASAIEQSEGGIGVVTKLLETSPDEGSLHEAVFRLIHSIIPSLSRSFLAQSGSDLVNTILMSVESSSDGQAAEAGSLALSSLLTELNKVG